jgi:putative endopeptidase
MHTRLAPLALAIGLVFSTSVLGYTTNERGLDRRNFDDSVQACTDFYRHANGGWLKNNPVPAAYSSWGVFNELNERNLAVLKSILEDAASQKNEPGSNAQKIGDFYAAAMDEAAIEKAGATPLAPYLARVDAADSAEDIVALIRDWHKQGVGVGFGFGAEADLKNSSQVIAYATQGGLSLPERDYYLKDDPESKDLRAKFVEHVRKSLRLAGVNEAEAAQQAQWILTLETRLAKASLDKVAMRNPENFYNIVGVADADAKTPHFSWSNYLRHLDLAGVKTFSLAQPGFFAEFDAMLADVPVAHWQAYLRWNIVSTASPYLSKAFVDQDFDFYSRTLRGTQELRPRWKRVMDSINDNLGEALGERFVARAFPPESKAKAAELVENLRTALKARLQSLEWMGDETKQKALAKLAAFLPKIGYPDRWRDYSKLSIAHESYFANVAAAGAFRAAYQREKIGKPADRGEWQINPQEVNAYYNPLINEIVFPAAILQPPFFDPKADDALNYGAIGAVIGHEMLHGFDDQGSKFDAQGNLSGWWDAEDRKRFEARTAKLVQQFGSYLAIGDLHVNGELTLGENIGDFGGLLVAYDALQLARADREEPKHDGFTQDQRFFLSWAQIWRRSYRDEQLKLQVNTDPHAPANFRVIGPLSNMDAFAKAFACDQDDPMVRTGEHKAAIW